MYNEKCCCFTGHRPQKLPWGFDENDPRCSELKRRIRAAIRLAAAHGMTMFLSGMAMGTDMWCAEAVLEIKQEMPGREIKLAAVIPHAGQEQRYPDNLKERYGMILSSADECIALQDHYTEGCMQRRNRYLVEHSSMLIAVYSGGSGGTKYTFDYANRLKHKIIWIDPVTGRTRINFNYKEQS